MWWRKRQRQKKETGSGKEIKSATQGNANIHDQLENLDKTCSVMYGTIFPFMGGNVTGIYDPEFCRRLNDSSCKCEKENKKITTDSRCCLQPSKYIYTHINKDKRTLLKKTRVSKEDLVGSRKNHNRIQTSSSERHIKWHERHKSASPLDSSGSSDSIYGDDNRVHVISEKTLEKVFKKYMQSLQKSQSFNETTGESPSKILASSASTQTSRSLLPHTEYDQTIKQQHSLISVKVTDTTNKSVQNAPMQQSTKFSQTTLETSKPIENVQHKTSEYSPESSTSYASAQSRTSLLQDSKSVQTIKSRDSLIDVKAIQPTNKSTQNASQEPLLPGNATETRDQNKPPEQSSISLRSPNTANKSDQNAAMQQSTKFSQTALEASKPIENVLQHKTNEHSSESSYASAQARTSSLQDSKSAQTIKSRGSLIDVKAIQPTSKSTQNAPQEPLLPGNATETPDQNKPPEQSSISLRSPNTVNKSDQNAAMQKSTKFSQTILEASKPIENVLQHKTNEHSSESSYASAQSRTSLLEDSKAVQTIKSRGSLIDVKAIQPTSKFTQNAPQEPLLPANATETLDQNKPPEQSSISLRSPNTANKCDQDAAMQKSTKFSQTALEASKPIENVLQHKTNEHSSESSYASAQARTSSLQDYKSAQTIKSRGSLIDVKAIQPTSKSTQNASQEPLLPANATETPDQNKPPEQSSISLRSPNTANKSDQNAAMQKSTKFSQTTLEASKPIENVLQHKTNEHSSESSYASAQSRTSLLEDSKAVQTIKSRDSLIAVEAMQPKNKSDRNVPMQQSTKLSQSTNIDEHLLESPKPVANVQRTTSQQTMKSAETAMIRKFITEKLSEMLIQSIELNRSVASDPDINKPPVQNSVSLLPVNATETPDQDKPPEQSSLSILPLNTANKFDQNIELNGPSEKNLVKVENNCLVKCPPCPKNCPPKHENKPKKRDSMKKPKKKSGNCYSLFCCCKKTPSAEVVEDQNLNKEEPEKTSSAVLAKEKEKSYNDYNANFMVTDKTQILLDNYCSITVHSKDSDKKLLRASKTDTRIERKCTEGTNTESTEVSPLFDILCKCEALSNISCELIIKAYDSESNKEVWNNEQKHLYNISPCLLSSRMNVFKNSFSDESAIIEREPQIKSESYLHRKLVQNQTINVEPNKQIAQNGNISSNYLENQSNEKQVTLSGTPGTTLVNKTCYVFTNTPISPTGLSGKLIKAERRSIKNTWLRTNKRLSYTRKFKKEKAKAKSRVGTRTIAVNTATCSMCKISRNSKSQAVMTTCSKSSLPSPCTSKIISQKSSRRLQELMPNKFQSQQTSSTFLSEFLKAPLVPSVRKSLSEFGSNTTKALPNMSNMSDELEMLCSGLKAGTSTPLILPPIPKPKTLNEKLSTCSDDFRSDIYKVANVLGRQTSTVSDRKNAFIDSYTQTRSIESVTQATQTINKQYFYHNLQNETAPKLPSGCKKNAKAEKVGSDTPKNKSSQFVSVPKLLFRSITDSDISYVLANVLDKYLSSTLIPLTSNRNKTNKNLTVRSTTILETSTQTKSSEFISLIPNITHQNFCRRGESLKPNILGMMQLISESLHSILNFPKAKLSNSKLNYRRTDHGDHGKIIVRPTKIGSQYDLETTLVSSHTKFEESEAFKLNTLNLSKQTEEIYLNSMKMESSCFIKNKTPINTYSKPVVLQPKLHSRYSIRCANVSSEEIYLHSIKIESSSFIKDKTPIKTNPKSDVLQPKLHSRYSIRCANISSEQNAEIYLHSIKMGSSCFIKDKIPINTNPKPDVLQPKLYSPRYSLTRKDNTVDFKNCFETSMESTRLSKFQTYDCQSSSNSYKQRCPTFATIMPATSTLSELKQIKSSGDDKVKEEEVTETSYIQSKATDLPEVQSVMVTKNSKTNAIKLQVGLKFHLQSKTQNKVRAPRSKNYEKMPVKSTYLRKRLFGTLPAETCYNNPSTSKNDRKSTAHRTGPPYLFLRSDKSRYSDAHILDASEQTSALFIGPAQLFLVTANTLSLAASNLQQRRQKRKTAWDIPLFLGD